VLSPRHVMLLVLAGVAACNETIGGQAPLGGTVDSEASIQRFLRRAHLDLAGRPPTEAELTELTARLQEAGNTPSARRALIDERIADADFGALWIEELENSIFGGNTLETQYALVCGIIRSVDPACMSCSLADSCACSCPVMAPYLAERELLATSAADFTSGTASSTIERRYATAYGYYVLAGSAEGRVRTLFDDFLGRPAEPEEIENGRAMVFGGILPGSPAGLLFHRHGANYDDLVDIVFASEIYREALVRRVFERYLARGPSSAELLHFTATLDVDAPDVRELVRAVVSSREYFAQ
jgi:hypothetical protein